MSGVMVILQVTFLYLADWYVRLDFAIASLQTPTSYDTYASSAQAGQSLFRTSHTLGRLQLSPHLDSSVFRRELDGLGIPALHPTNVCHIDVQMGAYALCGPRPRDGSCAIRTSKSCFFPPLPPSCFCYRWG
jgi:hypothetical protein